MYLLDTNIVSYWMRGDSGVVERIKAHSPADLALSSVTLAEILYGIEKSPHRKLERRERIAGIVSILRVLPFDEEAAAAYATVRAALEAQGRPISERDTQIAAVAMAQRLMVVTHNQAEFAPVPGLQIQDWA